jgi:hypothetical protein
MVSHFHRKTKFANFGWLNFYAPKVVFKKSQQRKSDDGDENQVDEYVGFLTMKSGIIDVERLEGESGLFCASGILNWKYGKSFIFF